MSEKYDKLVLELQLKGYTISSQEIRPIADGAPITLIAMKKDGKFVDLGNEDWFVFGMSDNETKINFYERVQKIKHRL